MFNFFYDTVRLDYSMNEYLLYVLLCRYLEKQSYIFPVNFLAVWLISIIIVNSEIQISLQKI